MFGLPERVAPPSGATDEVHDHCDHEDDDERSEADGHVRSFRSEEW
jgi:hypothetical protein